MKPENVAPDMPGVFSKNIKKTKKQKPKGLKKVFTIKKPLVAQKIGINCSRIKWISSYLCPSSCKRGEDGQQFQITFSLAK